MAGAEHARRRRGAVLLAPLSLILTATPLAAADETDTSAGVVLARGGVQASVVADLDGDGGNEVISVIYPADGSGALTLQAWGERDGTWSSLGEAPLELWGPDDDQPRPARATDGASVMVLRTARGAQVLVPVISLNEALPGGCCLSFSTVGLGPEGLRAELSPRLPQDTAVESLMAVDLEEDGVDELVATEYVSVDDGDTYEPRYFVLRQTASGWRRAALGALEQAGGTYLQTFGDTDGKPGAELIFMHNESTGLTRVYSEDGELRSERAPDGTLVGRDGGSIAAAVNGLLVLSDASGMAIAEWPRNGTPVRVLSADTGPYPFVMPLGEGPDARLVVLNSNDFDRNAPLGLRVYDLALELEHSRDAQPLVQALWDLIISGSSDLSNVSYRVYPHFGPIPGGLEGRPAVLGAGALVSLSASGDVDVQDIRPMVGASPVGLAGSGSDWLVNGPTWFGQPWSVGLYGGYIPESSISVVPLGTILDAGAPSASDSIPWQLQGAARTEVDGREILATAADGFEVIVSGEPGTIVVTTVGSRTQAAEVVEGPVTVKIDPGGRDDDPNERVEATMITISAAGLATSTTWDVDVYRQPPEVTSSTETGLFSLRSTVRGSATTGTSVTVDGQPVELDGEGAFRLEVDAPVWPRDVLVVARDPLGRESVQRLEVIGFVDYRGLPWIPIVGTLTVAAGLVLFVRTPRLRPEARLRPDGDGRLEEIDGDLI